MNVNDLAKRTIKRLSQTPVDWAVEMQWREGETPDEYHARLPWLPSGLTREDHVVTFPNPEAPAAPPILLAITRMDMDEL